MELFYDFRALKSVRIKLLLQGKLTYGKFSKSCPIFKLIILSLCTFKLSFSSSSLNISYSMLKCIFQRKIAYLIFFQKLNLMMFV